MGSDDADDRRLAAEQRARVAIDGQLTAAGWCVQDKKQLNLFAAQGVACREAVMAPGHGRADYLLYVDQKVVGVIEAKPMGTSLSGVEWQSAMYAGGLPAEVRLKALTVDGRLPFVFEASGTETHFTNGYDPNARARRVFNFPKAQTLARLLRDVETNPARPTWRAKVQNLPALDHAPLRPAQITAIDGVERSLAEQRFDRSLVQMATGAGKTFTAVTEAYRLLKFGGFSRVLFLVDRNNLADQTLAEFQNYRTPDDGRRFTEIYNVDKLTSAGMLGSSNVRHLDHPAGLQSAAQRGGDRRGRSRPRRLCARGAGHGHLQPITSAGDIRPGDRRRSSSVHLRGVAGAFASYLIRYRIDQTKVRPHWVHLAMESPRVRMALEAMAASSAGQHNLSLRKLDTVLIPLPPVPEQDRIIRQAEELHSAIATLHRELNKLDRRAESLRRALLAAAFSGRLTDSVNDLDRVEQLVQRPGAR